MIRGLDADDSRFEIPVVFVQVAEELELGEGRPDDQHGIGALDGSRDLLEETPRILGIAFPVLRAQRALVQMMLRRQHGRLLRAVGMEVKDPGFLVVDPGDGVRGHASMFRQNPAPVCAIGNRAARGNHATLGR